MCHIATYHGYYVIVTIIIIISNKKRLQNISQLNQNKHASIAHVMIKDVYAEDINNIQIANLCFEQPATTTIVSCIIL